MSRSKHIKRFGQHFWTLFDAMAADPLREELEVKFETHSQACDLRTQCYAFLAALELSPEPTHRIQARDYRLTTKLRVARTPSNPSCFSLFFLRKRPPAAHPSIQAALKANNLTTGPDHALGPPTNSFQVPVTSHQGTVADIHADAEFNSDQFDKDQAKGLHEVMGWDDTPTELPPGAQPTPTEPDKEPKP